MSGYKDIEDKEKALLAALRSSLGPRRSDMVFKSLVELIDAKIKHHKKDLEDKINETGEYDPEW